MNRRLHIPIIACSAAALVLAVVLASGPAAPDAVSATSTGQEHVTPPAVVRTPGSEQLAAGAGDAAPRSRSKRARSAIAMPYFSFSRGAGGRS